MHSVLFCRALCVNMCGVVFGSLSSGKEEAVLCAEHSLLSFHSLPVKLMSDV